MLYFFPPYSKGETQLRHSIPSPLELHHPPTPRSPTGSIPSIGHRRLVMSHHITCFCPFDISRSAGGVGQKQHTTDFSNILLTHKSTASEPPPPRTSYLAHVFFNHVFTSPMWLAAFDRDSTCAQTCCKEPRSTPSSRAAEPSSQIFTPTIRSTEFAS